MTGKKRVREIDSVAVVIYPQHPVVMKDNNGNAMLNAQGRDQPPLLLATKREDSEIIKGGMPLLLLLLLLDIETSLHLHHISIENHLPLLLGSHVDSKNRVPARKDDTDMTLHPLPPLPLLLPLQEDEDMKLSIKKTQDPAHLDEGPLLKKRRKPIHLLFSSRKQSPAVPLLPPPVTLLQGIGKEKGHVLALPLYMHLPLPHPQLEVETRRNTSKGGQDPVPQVTNHLDKGQGPGLGPVLDPEEGGREGAEIVAEGETTAIVGMTVVLQDIDEGAAGIDR